MMYRCFRAHAAASAAMTEAAFSCASFRAAFVAIALDAAVLAASILLRLRVLGLQRLLPSLPGAQARVR